MTREDQFAAHLHWLKDFPTQDVLRQHLLGTIAGPASRENTLAWWRAVREGYDRDCDAKGVPLRPWEAWCLAQAQPLCQTREALYSRLTAKGYLDGIMYA